MVLDQTAEGLAVGGDEELTVCVDDVISFSSAEVVLREMEVDFITVKIGVEGGAIRVVETNSALGCR